MASCKECMHENVCKVRHFPSLFGLTGDDCDFFKNKADFVEVKWISVKDRLPETNGKYLCADYCKTFNRHFIQVLSFAKDLYKADAFEFRKEKGKSGFYSCDGEWGYIKADDVTHWMPLPEPPMKEGAE